MNEYEFIKRSRSITLHPLEEMYFWIIELDHIDDNEVINAKSLLDDEALRYSSRYKFDKDRNTSILVHAILRYYLGKFLQQEPHEIKIRRTKFGKPYIENDPIHFNLSSTQQYAFLAFHLSRPLGIDIEYINDDLDSLKLAELFLHPREMEWFKRSPEPKSCFFNFWCAKEALLKAQGQGFLVEPLPELESSKQLSEGCMLFKSVNFNVYVYDGIIEKHKLAVCIHQ